MNGSNHIAKWFQYFCQFGISTTAINDNCSLRCRAFDSLDDSVQWIYWPFTDLQWKHERKRSQYILITIRNCHIQQI